MIDWIGNLHPLNLAAIVYRPDDDVDALLAAFADDLMQKGHRLGGIVQRNIRSEHGRRERMDVIDLMTGNALRICQNLGTGAAACKLNAGALAEAAMAVTRAVAANVELVVVNKFSKQEATGRGLRAEVAEAVAVGQPLLIAVRGDCWSTWMDFTGGFGTKLACERRTIDGWWQERSMVSGSYPPHFMMAGLVF